MKKSTVLTILLAGTAVFAADNRLIRHTLEAGGQAGEFRITAGKPEHFNRKPSEQSSVKATVDKDNLHLCLTMTDGDIISEAVSDQSSLHRFGDAVQIFIKSQKETYLWEFIFSPKNLKSCFFHLGPGAMFYPEVGSKFPEYTVKNSIKDGIWRADVSIPLSIFRAKGFKFDKDEKWTIMIVRHNYSREHAQRETSSYPQAVGNTADPDYFAELIIK